MSTPDENLAQALDATPATPSSAHPDRELSFGEKLVGLSFNPSGDPLVYRTKVLYAQIIDAMKVILDTSEDATQATIANEAISQALSAQMMAVKALTWK